MTLPLRVLMTVTILTVAGLSFYPHTIVAGSDTIPVVYPLPYRVNSPQVNENLELVALNLLNQERRAAGVNPLMPHATLRVVARRHGLELFINGYLSHLSSDGRTPLQRVRGMNVHVHLVGENLAYASDLAAAHEALVHSEDHLRNMLSPDYHLVGIGVIDGGPYGVIVVETFGD
jgi:uncharacterized protein YkwD